MRDLSMRRAQVSRRRLAAATAGGPTCGRCAAPAAASELSPVVRWIAICNISRTCAGVRGASSVSAGSAGDDLLGTIMYVQHKVRQNLGPVTGQRIRHSSMLIPDDYFSRHAGEARRGAGATGGHAPCQGGRHPGAAAPPRSRRPQPPGLLLLDVLNGFDGLSLAKKHVFAASGSWGRPGAAAPPRRQRPHPPGVML